MADTVDTGLLPRTYFKAPRVPFDFRGVTIAVFGYLVFWAGGLLLNEIFGKANITGSFLAAAYSIFEDLPFINTVIGFLLGEVFRAGDLSNPQVMAQYADYTFWHKLVGGIWFFGVWSYFGQAIHRIASLRIARDEGLSLVEAFKFAAKNWPTMLLAPVIIAATIAFFYGCNAAGGAVISIPYVGQLLGLIIVPLALISTLLILLIALGGVFGLPLIGAAAAWERNGTLDAISRAFSYVFARPLQFFWNYFLIFLFVGIILLVGSWFTSTLVKSVDSGVWSKPLSLIIDAPRRDSDPDSAFGKMDLDLQKAHGDLEAKTGYTPGQDAPNTEPYAKHIGAVEVGGVQHGLNAIVFWVLLNLIWLGVFGYAVYWFLGASTSVYADLRADVDGTEEDEIYLEEEEEEFEAFQEAVDSAVAAEGATAGEATPGDAPEKSEGDAAKETKDSSPGEKKGEDEKPSDDAS